MLRPLILIPIILLTACTGHRQPPEDPAETNTTFSLDFKDLAGADALADLIAGGDITCSGCSVSADTMAGHPALRVTTDQEFSDVFLHAEALFGSALDVTTARYLRLKVLVPEGSWIAALKLNFKDSLGNFGGVGEAANNFYGHYDRWLDIVVDLEHLLPDFKLWDGKASPLERVSQFSLNPYCAHQADSSTYYVAAVELLAERPAGAYHPGLTPEPDSVNNEQYLFTFDDPEWLSRQTAYRTFESSNQAFSRGIGGNETRAIRLRGQDHLNNIAWLPIISKVTGHPADFTKVSRVYFDYYLLPGGDEFDGSTLYLTSEHWNDILIDTAFYDNFVAGSWQTVSVETRDLQLVRAKGETPVLPAVHELRLNLNYRPGHKNIELWIDNFGWE